AGLPPRSRPGCRTDTRSGSPSATPPAATKATEPAEAGEVRHEGRRHDGLAGRVAARAVGKADALPLQRFRLTHTPPAGVLRQGAPHLLGCQGPGVAKGLVATVLCAEAPAARHPKRPRQPRSRGRVGVPVDADITPRQPFLRRRTQRAITAHLPPTLL